MTDVYYCGAKAGCTGYTDCSTKATDRLCSKGSCTSSCPSGTTACGSTCLDFDKLHIASCDNGAITCATGYADIDKEISNGCEVNINTDSMHCGTLNINCTTSLVGSVCKDGVCTCQGDTTSCAGKCLNYSALHIASCSGTAITACATGYADIDKDISNGCEVNLMTDNDNCGKIGINCITNFGPNYVCVNGGCLQLAS